MNANKAIQKYYLGLIVLFVMVLVVLGYTVSQASNEKIDRKTNDAVQRIADKMSSYTLNHGVPASLEQAGVTNVPSTITYAPQGADKYKICINYKSASSGFDASWFSLFGGGVTASSTSSSAIYPSSDYFDISVIYTHKKGENCQTVTNYSYITPYIYNGTNSTQNSTSTKTPSVGT